MAYRVVIAEDFRMIREIFEAAVNGSADYILAGSYTTAVKAAEYFEKNDADLVLMDVLFPGGMNSIEASRIIKARKPDVKIIVVTSMPELSYEQRAREAKVEGFWHKEIQEQSIIEIMDRVMAGEIVYPEKRPRVLMGNAFAGDLTDREIETLRELVAGLSNKEIAQKLNVEVSTVKMHISNMLQKTGYKSRLELAVKARHSGIIIND